MDKIQNWIYKDFKMVSSTNDTAKLWADNLKQNCIISAYEQTNGRGRRGNVWVSQKGNLFASYAFKIKQADLNRTVILSAVAIFETIKFFLPDKNIKIKWPNDILVEDAKISGILFEKGNGDFWVMGVGINIVSSPENVIYKTTNFKNFGMDTDRLTVLNYFTITFDKLLEDYYTYGFDKIKQTWLDNAYNLGKSISIKQKKETKKGIFLSIDDNGALILKIDDKTEKILVGELFIEES